MKNLHVDNDYTDYFMEYTIATYHDIKSKGVEYLRNICAQTNLAKHRNPSSHPEMCWIKRTDQSV